MGEQVPRRGDGRPAGQSVPRGDVSENGCHGRGAERASLLRHSGFAQADEKGRLKQGADFRHAPITVGPQTG
jgi:hypothetical protein